MNWKAAKTSALLCLLFLVVYGSCNRLTALRHDVGTAYFEWERHIPFIPIMIVPYMSIDLFFITAPFICRDDRERKSIARQISAAILISGACFLIYPLRFAFDRPPVHGPLGVIFNNFRALDQPFNQFPSLHFALLCILASLYLAHTRGAIIRAVAFIWFILIGASTVLTYQHHIIDIVGGLALGVVCMYLFQPTPLKLPVTPNRRIGIYYAIASALLIIVAIFTRTWGWLILWPAFSLAVEAAAYFHLGPGIFRKQNGRIPLLTWLILWPILIGQNLSLLYYKRYCEPWNILTPHIRIGRKPSEDEARSAIAAGVTAVLDLTGEFSEAMPFRDLNYCQLPILDLTAPTRDQLQQAIGFIRDQSATGIVYIHCKIGYSRTAAIAGRYLLATNHASSADEAIAMLRAARPSIIVRPEAQSAIKERW